MNYEYAFLAVMAVAGLYFFYLGEVTSKKLAASLHEHPVYIGEITTKAVMSYATSMLCFIAGILCILRLVN